MNYMPRNCRPHGYDMSTAQGLKSPPKPVTQLPPVDDECSDLDLIESTLIWLIAGIGTGLMAYFVVQLTQRF